MDDELKSQLDRIEQKLDQLLLIAGGAQQRVQITDPASGASITGTQEQIDGVQSEYSRMRRGDRPRFVSGEIVDI